MTVLEIVKYIKHEGGVLVRPAGHAAPKNYSVIPPEIKARDALGFSVIDGKLTIDIDGEI